MVLYPKITSWKPEVAFLFLLPSRISDTHKDTGIILPESVTKKANAGICFACGNDSYKDLYLDKECLFPNHQEYRVEDTDTGWLFYVVPHDKIIMTRTPPADVLRFSKEKAVGLSFTTIEHSKKD